MCSEEWNVLLGSCNRSSRQLSEGALAPLAKIHNSDFSGLAASGPNHCHWSIFLKKREWFCKWPYVLHYFMFAKCKYGGLERPMPLGQILLPLQIAVGGDPLLNWIPTISQGYSPFFSKLLVRKCAGCKLLISRQNKPQRKPEEMGCECVNSVGVIYFWEQWVILALCLTPSLSWLSSYRCQ